MSQERDSVPSGDPPAETKIRWACTCCGDSKSRRCAGADGEIEGTVVGALGSHAVGSDGDGHRPRNGVPAGSDRPLFESVRRVDGLEQ